MYTPTQFNNIGNCITQLLINGDAISVFYVKMKRCTKKYTANVGVFNSKEFVLVVACIILRGYSFILIVYFGFIFAVFKNIKLINTFTVTKNITHPFACHA
jgi:hypothetical protein